MENKKYDINLLKKAFKVLIGGAKIKSIGQVVNKDKDAMLNSEYNLQLLKYKLEKHGVLKTIGEVNGTPLSIKLTTDTESWIKIKQSAKDGMDSFSYVSRMLGIPILDIIHHLYDQDLKGNIEKLPAMKKDIFFELLTMELDDTISEKIVEEINNELDFRIMQLNELQELFSSNNHEEKLYAVLK